jgi:hypothetical protein
MIGNTIHHYYSVTVHKLWVAYYLLNIAWRLAWRALVHDLSKYKWDEAKHFVKVVHLLKDTEYGSDEYKQLLRSIRPAIDLHYSRNTHHPENADGYINAMDALDEIEMICDWCAASRRHGTGDPVKSAEMNVARFGIAKDRQDFYLKLMSIIDGRARRKIRQLSHKELSNRNVSDQTN